MIIINKNANNNLYVTLNENETIVSPYYLWVLQSDVTREKVLFLAENISTHTDRYDEFLITERSTNLDFTSGIIECNPSGQWTYKVYEQASSSNLDETLTGSILETGILKVVGTSPETYHKHNTPNTYKVHERQ